MERFNEIWPILVVMLVIGTIAFSVRKQMLQPKWKQVLFYVTSFFHGIDVTRDEEMLAELKQDLMWKYELTPRQVEDVIAHVNDPDWFEKNIKD